MLKEWISQSTGRLDAVVVLGLPDLSRSTVQKLIKNGSVLVNDELIRKTAFLVEEGDSIVVTSTEAPLKPSSLKPTDLHLEVLYEDDACLVIAKPAGIAVHPAPSIADDEATILHGIAFLFQERSLPFSPEGVLVHRLDRETTGCLLIAKNLQSHSALQKQFEHRTVKKTYLAIVAGVPSSMHAMIDAPIGRHLSDRTKMSVHKTAKSREAQTSYTVLDTTNEAALLACDLHTGRTHQIRVHLSSIGHPLLGDPTYTSQGSEKLTEIYAIDSLCLHAWKLSFQSPDSKKTVEIVAPITQEFASSLASSHLHLS